MCIGNAPEPRRYYDWTCAKYIEEGEYAAHDRLNHDLEEEGFQEKDRGEK